MTTKVKKNRINFKGKMVSVGIDMHKHSWRITAFVQGDIVMAVTLARPNYDSLKKVLAQFEGNDVRVAYEAGPGGFDLYYRLTADSIECIVTPPSLIPTESSNKVKTDDKALLFMRRTIGKFPLGVKGKFDHNICGFEDQVRRGDCEWLKKWEAVIGDVRAEIA